MTRPITFRKYPANGSIIYPSGDSMRFGLNLQALMESYEFTGKNPVLEQIVNFDGQIIPGSYAIRSGDKFLESGGKFVSWKKNAKLYPVSVWQSKQAMASNDIRTPLAEKNKTSRFSCLLWGLVFFVLFVIVVAVILVLINLVTTSIV